MRPVNKITVKDNYSSFQEERIPGFEKTNEAGEVILNHKLVHKYVVASGETGCYFNNAIKVLKSSLYSNNTYYRTRLYVEGGLGYSHIKLDPVILKHKVRTKPGDLTLVLRETLKHYDTFMYSQVEDHCIAHLRQKFNQMRNNEFLLSVSHVYYPLPQIAGKLCKIDNSGAFVRNRVKFAKELEVYLADDKQENLTRFQDKYFIAVAYRISKNLSDWRIEWYCYLVNVDYKNHMCTQSRDALNDNVTISKSQLDDIDLASEVTMQMITGVSFMKFYLNCLDKLGLLSTNTSTY